MVAAFGPWHRNAAQLAEQFATAQPFPHVVIDDFLDHDFALQLLGEFPAAEEMPHSRDYVFGDKRELSSLESRGPVSKSYHDMLLSEDFAAVLERLTGRRLFVDPAHHGGGFHRGTNGSYLDTHVDFNVHPLHDDWRRTLNILLYLCPDWRPEYDGALLVRTSPDDEPTRILPGFNRAVIMLTGDNTYHGYRKMTLPPGVSRNLIATYAYELVRPGSLKARSTSWAPESGRTKQLLARYHGPLTKMKNKVLGSGTAKNR